MLEAIKYVRVVNDAPGYVKKVLVASGMKVQTGTPLIELLDRELEIEIEATMAQREETLVMRRKAMRLSRADLEPIKKRLETIEAKLGDLKKQEADLIARARQPGVWVAPEIQDLVGSWLSRGSEIGNIVNHDAFRFLAGLAITFRVGKAETLTAAARRLPNVDAVRTLLEWLARRPAPQS